MALVECGECAAQISDKAAACPQCGAPAGAQDLEPAQQDVASVLDRNYGCFPLVLIAAAIGIAIAIWFPKSDRTSSPRPVEQAVSAQLQRDAIQQFTGMPGIRHAEWVDGDLTLAVRDNGSEWRPVADSACAWLRLRGAPPGFAVVILEASALQNKRWSQLARARCN